MAAMLGGGGDGMPLEQWFFEMPVCTRWWTTATVIVGVLVRCKILSPFGMFYSVRTVFTKQEYWRLFSTFIYFGPLDLNLLFHVFFIQRYARMLEEAAASTAHFSWLMSYSAITLLCLAPITRQEFLGQTLSSVLVYIWARRNPDVRLSFLGLLNFKAPWLPWVLIAFNTVLHNHFPKDELTGIAVGHVYYFFNDIFPSTHGGWRPLDPPQWWISLFERRAIQEDESPESEFHAAAINRDLAPPAIPDIR